MTVGYVGMGRIARAVAERLAPFSTHGVFFDPAVDSAPGGERVSLDELLRRSDVVTLHVPLTASTRHLIGARELAVMKAGAYLVNTSRGGLVDEAALIEALAAGRLAGAALDVFETEPLPAGHALGRLPNVVLTPHIAAGTRDALATKMRAVFANLDRFFRGEPLANRVF
jgi:phosphoglycerate dehydrogenase-like enzyme